MTSPTIRSVAIVTMVDRERRHVIADRSPPPSTVPRVTSDSSLAAVTYRVGSIGAVGAGARKQVTFVYRVQ